GDLKLLKYLDLSDTKIEEIPGTVCNLYNLQTLLLKNCFGVTQLPTNIGNLINLRHLHTPPHLKEMPLQIGKIKTLQTLNEFVVSKNSRYAGIKQLKELQDLHGTLEISGLENVVDVKDALEAELKNKKFLNQLELYWDWDDSHVPNDSQKEREVLRALQPHANLKELSLCSYQGTSFPDWVGNHLYTNLVKVILSDCDNCYRLPPLGQLSSLRQLEISGFPIMVRISSEFYSSVGSSAAGTKPFRSLESLYISEMSSLEELSFTEGELEGGVFPRLKELSFEECPRLKVSLPDYLPSLRKLKIKECNRLMPLLPRAQQMEAAFPSLESLSMSYCPGQDSLLEGGLPSSLKQVIIFRCINLTSLDEQTFQHLTSLEKLTIFDCANIRCLPGGLPTSLSYLSIKNCHLLKQRLQRESGEDWYIVENIPTLIVTPDSDY
ncbi:LRR domain containing protein, partial [Trema orientale]